MAINFPNSPANGDIYQGFIWNASIGAWDVYDSLGTLDSLSDVNTSGATASQVLAYNGTIWAPSAPVAYTVSDTAPSATVSGMGWLNSSNGKAYIYYKDGTSSQWIEISGQQGVSGALLPYEINAQAGTSYTLSTTEAGKLITFSSSSAVTLTVPLNSIAAIAVGTQIAFMQTGTGQITVAPAAGVTLRSTTTLKTRSQYSVCTLIKIAVNEWVVLGDLAVF